MYSTLEDVSGLVGSLVVMGEWTYYPMQLGQVIEIIDICTCKIYVSGEVKVFADFDYEVIHESR